MKFLIASIFLLLSFGAFAQPDADLESNSYDVLCIVNLVGDTGRVINAFYGNGLNEAEACNTALNNCYTEIDSWGPRPEATMTECKVVQIIDNSSNK